MIAVFVSFRFESGIDGDAVRAIAEQAQHRFAGMSGVVTGLYGVRPSIRYADVAALVDNASSA
jgi:hypothetical protein